MFEQLIVAIAYFVNVEASNRWMHLSRSTKGSVWRPHWKLAVEAGRTLRRYGEPPFAHAIPRHVAA